jgi:hypothetical protein
MYRYVPSKSISLNKEVRSHYVLAVLFGVFGMGLAHPTRRLPLGTSVPLAQFLAVRSASLKANKLFYLAAPPAELTLVL